VGTLTGGCDVVLYITSCKMLNLFSVFEGMSTKEWRVGGVHG
jgi:hypothetical protein